MLSKQSFPILQETWAELFQRFLWAVIRNSSPTLRQIAEYPTYEGGGIIEMQYQDGGSSTVNLESIAGKFEIKRETLRNTDIDSLMEELTEDALDFVKNMSQLFFRRLDEITKEAGQIYNAGGKPLDFDTILKMYEMLECEFDEHGQPISKYRVPLPPRLFKTLSQKIPEWEKDPKKKKRFDELMQRKREEFYAKEANRKLVD